MATTTEKFLNYNGLVKLISLIKANFNKATIAEKNITATADTNDKYYEAYPDEVEVVEDELILEEGDYI